MPIDFRKPQYFKEFRFGNNLIWNTIKKFLNTFTGEIVRFFSEESEPIVKLEANFTPIQDLNGYDAPWPPGGGVNKLPPAASFAPVTVGDATITPYPDGHYHVSKVAGSNSSSFIINLATPVEVTTNQYIRYISTGNSGNMIANLRDGDGNTLNGGYWGKPSANISNAGTATNFNFYFTSSVSGEYDLYPIISNSSVDTFSPFSNICPISGHTGCEVVRTGVNLFDKTSVQAGYIDNSDGQVKGTTASLHYKCTDFIPVLSGNTYYVKSEQTAAIWGAWYDSKKNYVSGITGYVNAVITAPSTACYVRLTVGRDDTGNIDTFGVNYPSTDTDYHAYTGTTVSISFPAFGANKFGPNTNPQNGYYLDGSGVGVASSGWVVSDYIPVKAETTYFFQPNSTGGFAAKDEYYDSNKQVLPAVVASGPNIFTTPSDCAFMRFSYRDTSTNIMLNEGSTSAPYKPYTNTAYSGTLTVFEDGSGQAVAETWNIVYDGSSDETWGNDTASNYGFWVQIPTMKSGSIMDGKASWLLTYTGSESQKGKPQVRFGTGNKYIYCRQITNNIPGVTDLATWKTFLSENNLQVTYPLAEPVTIPLTASQINTLVGENNVWVNDATGDITVQAYGTEIT